MAINFTGDIFPFYATNVITDAEYLAVDLVRRDATNEQGILTMIEVVRAYMAELRDDDEARIWHYVMGRMMAGMSNSSYADIVTRVDGNDPGVFVAAANGDTVDVTDANGTDAVVLAAGPFADVDAVVADINGQIVTAVFVEAYNAGGVVGFRNTAGNEGAAFTLANGAGPFFLPKAGITAGDFVNPVEAIANAARDDALAHFERQGNPTAP